MRALCVLARASIRRRWGGPGEPRFRAPGAPAERALQFGHGGETVENREQSVVGELVGRGFNSATVVRPWRTTTAPSGARRKFMLSVGHRGGNGGNLQPCQDAVYEKGRDQKGVVWGKGE